MPRRLLSTLWQMNASDEIIDNLPTNFALSNQTHLNLARQCVWISEPACVEFLSAKKWRIVFFTSLLHMLQCCTVHREEVFTSIAGFRNVCRTRNKMHTTVQPCWQLSGLGILTRHWRSVCVLFNFCTVQILQKARRFWIMYLLLWMVAFCIWKPLISVMPKGLPIPLGNLSEFFQ